MLKQEGLQAVVIASMTTVHAEQAIKAIDANFHVLCEKPLSTSVEVVRLPQPLPSALPRSRRRDHSKQLLKAAKS